MATPTEGEGATGLPQLNFETFPSQIFWLAVCLGVLYWMLTRIALPRISSVLEERADQITDDLDRAEEFRRKAEEAQESYEQALRDARARAREIAAENRAAIQKDIDAAQERADERIAERVAESEARIAEIRESAMGAVDQVARETAMAIIESVMPDAADRSAVDAAVEKRT